MQIDIMQEQRTKHCHCTKHRKMNSIRRFMTGIAALVMVMSLSFDLEAFLRVRISKAENLPEEYYKKLSQA